MRQRTTISSDDTYCRRLLCKPGPQQTDVVSFTFLAIAVACQAITIVITWELWQARGIDAHIINLPWFGMPPQFDYGWLLIFSLVLTLISPKHYGFAFHALVLSIAIATDQLRCQPQILSTVVLIAACIFPWARKFAIWFLIAMWLWAGTHKLLSPDWFGDVTYYLLFRKRFDWMGFHLWDYHRALAAVAAVAEVGLGVFAWYRPKLAAPICFLTHVAIAAFLIFIVWNFSVLPWNFCTAIVGTWLLWSFHEPACHVAVPLSKTGKLAVAILLLSPIGFYFGMLRHSLCHVLYSANFPDAVITKSEGLKRCEAIKTLRVPFPHEPKAFLDFFRLTGKPGEKLHIREYRVGLESRFFEMSPQQIVKEITRRQFFDSRAGSVAGVAFDDRRKLFRLDKEFHTANLASEAQAVSPAKILKRSEDAMVWAIKFAPVKHLKQSYELIDGLPNLEQIQLSGSNITDDQLKVVRGAQRLRGIGLDDTAITDNGLNYLTGLPNLETIQAARTHITNEAIQRTLGR